MKAKESYDMSKSFRRLMNRYLQYHESLEKINNRMNAGGLTKKQWKELEQEKEDLQYEKDLIDRSKTDLLNSRIFPAMADLTVLMEKMREYRYIREVFEDDVNNLFFARSKTRPEEQTHIFYRFLHACVAKHKGTGKDSNESRRYANPENNLSLPIDARFILGEYMQKAVLEMVHGIEQPEFGNLTFLRNKLMEDIENATQWITMLAQRAHEHLEINEDRRPALF